jgi:replicative DNA helicase
MDKLPPHSPESEMFVIGCCLTTPIESIAEASAVLTGPHFYDLRNRTIWESIASMRPDEVDIITVRQSLKDANVLDKIGSEQYLCACQDVVTSSANLPAVLDILIEQKIRRDIIAASTESIQAAYEAGNAHEILDCIESKILQFRPAQNESSGIKELVHAAIGKIESKFLNGDKITGLETGLIDLDRLTDGLHPAEMVVIAALPSRGKTALAVNIAVRAALNKTPALILSAEMRPVQLVVRSICSESRVNFHRVKENDMPAITAACCRLNNAPLFIERASGFTIGQIKAIARRHHQKHAIKLIVIDYQQRLIGEGDNQEGRIASISKGVKDIAMELDVPVILLSQVNAAGETKHARATAEDADSLWKLENEGELNPNEQTVKLIVEKCRDGQTGYVMLQFCKEFTRFESAAKVSDQDFPPSYVD